MGISLGVDRIYDVLEELNLFPESAAVTTRVLVTQFDADSETLALPLLRQLRAAGHNAELYPDAAKLKKQLDYADRKRIPFVVLIGPDERAAGKLTLKDMTSGEQYLLSTDELLVKLD